MPNMVAFDAVSREVCVARRGSTSTPLQALVLLNDPQFVEAARALGERSLKETTPAERVRFVFRTLAAREPSGDERSRLTTLYENARRDFGADPAAAAGLLRLGDRKPDPTLAPAELAAAAVLAQTILNLDAVIWKR
jgi:hypothetical protein